jgi:hypothetical protein
MHEVIDYVPPHKLIAGFNFFLLDLSTSRSIKSTWETRLAWWRGRLVSGRGSGFLKSCLGPRRVG